VDKRGLKFESDAGTGQKRAFFKGLQGYTLLELLVVLIIIIFVSAFVVPKLGRSLGNLNIKTAAKRLSASLRYARNSATSEKSTYIAFFDIDDNKLLIVPEKEKFDETLQNALSDEERRAKAPLTYELPPDIKIEKAVSHSGDTASDSFSIFFFPNGSSSGGEITLTSERDNRLEIFVDFITGSVKVKNPGPKDQALNSPQRGFSVH
jgi:general secretion pathway protein H